MDTIEKSAHTLFELNEFLRGMRDPGGTKPIIDFLMDFENPEVQKFLTLLKEHQVQYMIVGGMATALHGHPRATVDLDLLVKEEPANKRKLIDVFRQMDVAGAERYLNVDMVPGWSTVPMGNPGFEVDLMAYTKAFDESEFDNVYKRSVDKEIHGIPVRVISLDDLIREKKMVGRGKDLEDIKKLQALNNMKSNNGVKVNVLSKVEFESLISSNSLDEKVMSTLKNTMFISILDRGEQPFFKNSNNFISVEFDDVEKDYPGEANTLSVAQAKVLIKFIKKNRKAKQCFIHCTAGISRSGSIGKFIVDELEGDAEHFKNTNQFIDVKRHFLKTLEEGKKALKRNEMNR